MNAVISVLKQIIKKKVQLVLGFHFNFQVVAAFPGHSVDFADFISLLNKMYKLLMIRRFHINNDKSSKGKA